jgi:purine-binding chemotaxis protein CheW
MNTDWAEVHRRLDAAAKAIARDDAPTAMERKNLLEARARALAREAPTALAAGKSLQIVEFRLASEAYAVESRFVCEIQLLRGCTPMSSTPSFIVGVINVRGRIVSVVNLKEFFDLPEKGLNERDNVIVIGEDQMEFGILADSIVCARAISVADIAPPIPTLSKIGSRYIKGIVEARMIVIDAQRLLSDEDMVICQEDD